MSSKYHLKISNQLKKIFELYIKLDPLNRHNTVSQYLHSIINEKANEILKYLKNELDKGNKEISKILNEKEYEDVKKALELDLKF
ncbi:MAG: hypothetical protein ACP6IY_11060 [Promethearchaeia archaeon]